MVRLEGVWTVSARRVPAAALATAILLGALTGCHDRVEPEAPPPPAPVPTEAPSRDETIRVATFNIRVFGKAKRSRPSVMAVLVATVRRYDVVAVQEIKDASGETPAAYLEAINAATGPAYDMLVSPRTGATASPGESEQYAFYYDTTTIEPLDRGELYPDPSDAFVREPWTARFRALGGFTFVLLNVHTQPRAAVAEISALHEAIGWSRQKYPAEDDFIALGDFNASCDYASADELDALALRGEDYGWIVPDDADTNLAASACAYDRIVISAGARGDFTGAWGVDRGFRDPAISDHFPVWATFYASRDRGKGDQSSSEDAPH